MAVKKVILHLGMSKAGSTSIQHTLFTNSTILAENGYRYLTEWGENHLLFLRYFFSSYKVKPLDKGFYGKPITNEERESIIKSKCNTMVDVINTTECETLIISGEFDWELNIKSTIEKIKLFCEQYFKPFGIEVVIILIIRNPLNLIISTLQQYIYTGLLYRNDDFIEKKISIFKGLSCLNNHFQNSLVFFKFEDAIFDKDGLVGYFLKKIGFPESIIPNLNISIENESNCMEVIEFAKYIEDREPIFPFSMDEYINPNRKIYGDDLLPLRNIKGTKFDLPYEHKIILWERLKEIVCMLKNSIGIDYTGYRVLPQAGQETYGEETIQGFIEAFPNLTPILQKLFLDFFRNKYIETLQVKFAKLYLKGSIPCEIYKSYEEKKKLSDENLILIEKTKKYLSDINKLLVKNQKLSADVNKCTKENQKLSSDVNKCTKENQKLSADVNKCTKENQKLSIEVEILTEKYSKQTEENVQLLTSLKQTQLEKNAMLNSRSWRITKPLRSIIAMLRKFI